MNEPHYPDAKRPTIFADGIEFQDFVCSLLAREHIILQNLASKKYQYSVGENLQGFEIKLDNRCTETGRLSIEIAEKSRADMPTFVPSGIYRNDNSWLYIQGNLEIIFIFAKNLLQGLHRSGKYQTGILPTIKTFYLPFTICEKYAAKIILCKQVENKHGR